MTKGPSQGLVFSQGAPSGVGPDLLLWAASQGLIRKGDLVFAGRELLARRAQEVPKSWAKPGWIAIERQLERSDDPLTSFDSLRLAVDHCLEHRCALVTPPIDKAEAVAEGLPTPGHTGYLGQRSSSEAVMLMLGPKLRVALWTEHLPLSEVSRSLDPERLIRLVGILGGWLRSELGLQRPRIGVLALNPHAGERGTLGSEDAELVEPAIRRAAAAHPDCELLGPLSADTAFWAHAQGSYDALIAAYHDQGLGPFKLLHFHEGVNFTLGLPFRRASPDHGTAVDLAGTGEVQPVSFAHAIACARGNFSFKWSPSS